VALAPRVALMLAIVADAAQAQVTRAFSLSAGPTTATSQTIDGNAHGWGGQAALWLSLPHVPLGLRAGAALYRFDERRFRDLCPADSFAPGCGTVSYRDMAGVGTLSLTFEPFRGRFSPYLLGGVGVYRLANTETHYPASWCPPNALCILPSEPARSYHEVRTHFGTSAGGGVAVRVGRVRLTAEARYHRYNQIVGRGHMVPVTLGVRF
jgi:hypothetical protein